MEKQKFSIGEEVKFEFIGKVTGVYTILDKLYYEIDNGNTFARRVTEDMLVALPTEKDLEKSS